MTKNNKTSTEHPAIKNIKRPILLPAGFIVTLLLIIFFYTLYSQEIKNSDENMLKIIASVEQSFLRKIDQKAFYIASQVYYLNSNPCIISALSKQNKQQLKTCSIPTIEQLQDIFELTALNYVDQEKNYLLTTSANDSQILLNDNKSHYFITDKAINTGQSSYGIDLSNNLRLQLIMTLPLIKDSEVIAYVEVITDIWGIFHSLEDNFDISLFVLIEKQHLEKSASKQSYIEQYEDFSVPSWDYFNQHILLHGDESLLGEEQKNYFGQEDLLNKMVQTNFTNDGNFYAAGHFELLNGSGEFIGHLGLIADNTLNMKSIQQLLINFISSYLILTSILFFLFYHYIHRLEEQLKNYFQTLKDEIYERKQTEASLKKLSSAVEHSGSAVMITNKSGVFEYVNPGFTDITGYSFKDVIGKTPAILKVKQGDSAVIKKLWESILSGKRWVSDIQNRRKNGEVYWSRLSISPIFDDDNQITHFVGVSDDISKLKKAHDNMRHMAFYDALTQLPNRRLFFDRLKQTLERTIRNKTSAAIFFLDLDKFKEINDTLGHDAGDVLLKEVSNRLSNILRESDTVARQGGDEFTMIIENLKGNSLQIRNMVEKLVQKIFLTMAEPVNLLDTESQISMSIGITICPADGYSIEKLLKNADIAMYHSKNSGRNIFTFYHADLQ